MTKRHNIGEVFALIVMVGLLSTQPALAKDARLRIRVRPGQACIFVDGVAKGDAD
jgi:hypothetical protein